MSDQHIEQQDPIARALRTFSQNITTFVFGLLPLIFIPIASAPFDYTKVIVVITGVLIVIILHSLAVLRTGAVRIGVSYPICALWVVSILALISALLSGDFKDALVGDLFSIHSASFVILLALIPTIWMSLKTEKTSIIRMYLLLSVSTLVLVVFHFLRLFLGSDFLSFQIFTGSTTTPVGSWNDLALFLGITVILSLLALDQLSLTRMGRGLFVAISVLSLLMLGVINFFTVWVILGLTSLVLIVYSLGKNRFSEAQPTLVNMSSSNITPLSVALIVFAVSVLFVVGGSGFGGFIAKHTGISHVEVRPSLEATMGIARRVYAENAFLGTGPNKFTDAWRLYKDNSINATVFWNTDFNAGNSYITTFFITTGVLGGVAWIIFLALYIVTGVRGLIQASAGDRVWYFIATSSFVTAAYIWGMTLVYVPGVTILLLGALCTGISLSALSTINGASSREVVLGANRRTGLLLTLGVIVIIIVSVTILYVASRHYSAVFTFNESVRAAEAGGSVGEVEKKIEQAYQLSTSDLFARRIAEYELIRMNSLASLQNPTTDEQSQFQNASVMGVNAAQQAIQMDPEEPANWSVLGGIYSILASVGVEGAQERALEAIGKSREFNPKNPLPLLESAIIASRTGNIDGARASIQQAIQMKPNFTEAFFLLSQLEIATGNVDAAIQSTQAVINLEPQNPARYYQLGVLLSSKGNTNQAVTALEKAIELDQNYANARYILALAYDELGRGVEAKQQLEVVLSLNPGNIQVLQLIQALEKDGSLKDLKDSTQGIVNEALPVTNNDGTVSSPQTVESSLINEVNTAPKTSDSQ